MLTPTVLFDIRATRSSPPGYAGENPERRGVYGAALAQFDELISAAESVGTATRPLPLFYALSQAGRAIAAAHAAGAWRLRAHGLSATELSHPLLDTPIVSDPLRGTGPDVADSPSALAAATGSDMFTGSVSIRELWASLPELCGLLPEKPQIRPLLLVPEGPDPENIRIRTDPSHLYGVIITDGSGEDLEELLHAHYPGTETARLLTNAHMQHALADHTPYGPGYLFRWPLTDASVTGRLSALDRIAPAEDAGVTPDSLMFSTQSGFEARWLRPAVGGVALSPLLSWWTLLFGLSMLARYEPDAWISSLQYDSAVLAAPLAQLLQVGLERVPELVLDALID